jgi:hypothetical protein
VFGINVNEERGWGEEYSRMMHRAFGKEFLGLDIGRTGDNGVINDGLSICKGVLVFQRETSLLASM